VILGDGEQREDFTSKAREKGVLKYIYMPGAQEIPALIFVGKVAKCMLVTHGGVSLIELGARRDCSSSL